MKIVGIRFGLCEDIGQSGVYLHRIVDGIPGQVVTSNYVQYGKPAGIRRIFLSLTS